MFTIEATRDDGRGRAMKGWRLAELDTVQIELVEEAERTLGTDYVLVYSRAPRTGGGTVPGRALRPAALDQSRLDCLQGLERQLGAVAVAYCREDG